MLLLTFLMPLIGLFPRLTLPLLVHAASNLTGQGAHLFPHTVYFVFGILSRIFILFLMIVLALMLLRQILLKIHGSRLFRTWDCGARIPDSRLQYTGSSFAALFLDLIPWVVPRKTGLEKPEGFFPEKAVYESHAEDRIESLLIRPMITAISWMLKPFEKIQSGKTRQYLLYGLVFLVLILVSIIGAYR
jgi:hydrogenase-4 component B